MMKSSFAVLSSAGKGWQVLAYAGIAGKMAGAGVASQNARNLKNLTSDLFTPSSLQAGAADYYDYYYYYHYYDYCYYYYYYNYYYHYLL